jgi:stage II sporulation protein P
MRIQNKLLVTCVMLIALVASYAGIANGEEWGERHDGGYYRLVDLDGKFVTETALELDLDDIYIAENNDRYVVDRFDGDTVYMRYDGKEKMPVVYDSRQNALVATWQWAMQLTNRAGGSKVIGIYQTHSDESYKASSGVESQVPRGDIYQVGKTLADNLKAQGYSVVFSDAVHLPHDGQAYLRSRRTAAEISRQAPTTIIDVHRDAIPNPESYRTQVNGEGMTKVRLVVGRQNQNRATNLEYAKRIKAVADEKYPGLIKGIFHAKGNYNQDLGPRMILLEFGTHTTTLEEAQKSAKLIADIIPAAAGLAPGTARTANAQFGSAGVKTVYWLIGLSLVIAAGWYFLNKEGFWLRLRRK